MRKKVILTLCVLCGFFLEAQVNIDSLYTIWQDNTQSDSIRSRAFTDYIWDGFLFSQPDTAFILAQELVLYGRDNNFPKAQAGGYIIQGVLWKNRGDYSKTLDYYIRAKNIYKQMGDQSGIAVGLHNIGTVYDNQGDYPRALDYYIKSLEVNEKIGNQLRTATTLSNIGVIYRRQGDYIKALEYYLRGLEVNEQIGDQHVTGVLLGHIGSIHYKQGEELKALDYYNRSLEINEQISNQSGIAGCYSDIGKIYYEQEEFLKALSYFNRSLEISEQIGDPSGIARSLISIGVIHHKQRHYLKSLNNCQMSYELSLSIGSLKLQEASCSCLYDTYKDMGDGNKALKYLELLNTIEDSLHTEDTSKKLQQMEFTKQVYADSVEKAEEARLIQKAHEDELAQKNKTRNVLIGSGILALFLAGGFFRRWRYVRKSKAVIEKEKERSENLLLNILPAEIAAELKEHGEAAARDFEQVSILFTDFKQFTQLSEKIGAKELVAELNYCFKAFDSICEKYGIEKIKTLGDSYMAAGGLPVPKPDSCKKLTLAALDMASFVINRQKEREAQGQIPFKMRTGIHTGNVVAGIVGVKKFQYDLWGDTVNTASRMESHGEVGKVNISQTTYELLKDDPQFSFESRGKVEAKGKGKIEMYFVSKK